MVAYLVIIISNKKKNKQFLSSHLAGCRFKDGRSSLVCPCEMLYNTRTWLAGFLFAADTGGDDLTATEGKWRRLQEGSQA